MVAAAGSGTPAARLLMLAVLMASITTVHLIGGDLARTWHDPLHSGAVLLSTWSGQLVASWGMLTLLARGYPWATAVGARATRRLWTLGAGCALVGTFVQSLWFVARGVVEGHVQIPVAFLWLWHLSLSALLVLGHHFAQRSRHAATALQDGEMAQLAMERELASAQLQLLQAQVEPHFLFNALANVRRLLRTDAAAARTLLADLLLYLEEALPQLRAEHSTLGHEAELVRAYLAVHQVRMGARLQAQIDVPPELALHPVPPMVLLTLVENALKHGLQPRVDGGTLRISARAAAGELTLTVADTGQGMGSGSGHGTGLANLRARLRSMYGAKASLALAVNEPRGVVATVVLPESAP